MRSDLSKAECYKILDEQGYFEYGTTIPRSVILDTFGIAEIEYPAMRGEIKQQELEELTVTGYIRDKLLNKGKYFKGEKDAYRVLLPSENASQVMAYMTSADKKLKRAIKLNQNTPMGYKIPNQDEVRLFMKKDQL